MRVSIGECSDPDDEVNFEQVAFITVIVPVKEVQDINKMPRSQAIEIIGGEFVDAVRKHYARH